MQLSSAIASVVTVALVAAVIVYPPPYAGVGFGCYYFGSWHRNNLGHS